MEILKRLALVIHWFWFVVGVFSAMYVINTFGESLVDKATLGGAVFVASTFSGWVVRFILVGKIPFLPFTKDEDSWF
tara:strand:+ start:119 stop:349 length:231 start_codon:yes stop_codon:yes gene_type:complete